jgi:sugar lactone lactonase YvrE/DNA-binding IclR family transcriptional regulator
MTLMTAPGARDANRSATLAKGLDILNFISAHSTPLRLRDIMIGLDLPKPTAHRILATLTDYGLVRYNKDAATYQLGMRLIEMSRRVWQDFDLRGAAAVEMSRLSEVSGEAIALALISDQEATYIDEIESIHQMRQSGHVGQPVPLWQTAMGKALTAGMAYEARRKLLDATPDEEIARTRFGTRALLSAHLDLVNARGYAIELEEHQPGVMGVAAPILDHRGLTVAAIGLSGPKSRLSRERLHELGPMLIEATRRASLRAGGSPRPVSSVPKPAVPPSPAVKVAANTRNLIGESPVWDSARNRLFWVDICRPAIYRLDCATGETATFRATEMVTALELHPEGLLAASQSGIRILDPENGEIRRLLGHPEPALPTNRFNDGKCDSRGRFWVGTMALNVRPEAGSLYRMDGEDRFERMETGLTLPNGLGWSPDETTMYVTDTAARTIYAYDFDAGAGTIRNRRPFIVFPHHAPGAPDGLAVDHEGSLWIALWDGWRVVRYGPDGALQREIVMPVPRPTSCAMAGRGSRTLYVTSARIRIAEQSLHDAPYSGAVFTIEL